MTLPPMPPGTGPAPGVAVPPGSRRNGLGTAALVSGLLALPGAFLVAPGVIFGALAIVCGIKGRARVRRGEATNGGQALSGLVLGSVAVLFLVAVVGFGALFYGQNRTQIDELQDCLRTAGADTTAQTTCRSQFETKIGR